MASLTNLYMLSFKCLHLSCNEINQWSLSHLNKLLESHLLKLYHILPKIGLPFDYLCQFLGIQSVTQMSQVLTGAVEKVAMHTK